MLFIKYYKGRTPPLVTNCPKRPNGPRGVTFLRCDRVTSESQRVTTVTKSEKTAWEVSHFGFVILIMDFQKRSEVSGLRFGVAQIVSFSRARRPNEPRHFSRWRIQGANKDFRNAKPRKAPPTNRKRISIVSDSDTMELLLSI